MVDQLIFVWMVIITLLVIISGSSYWWEDCYRGSSTRKSSGTWWQGMGSSLFQERCCWRWYFSADFFFLFPFFFVNIHGINPIPGTIGNSPQTQDNSSNNWQYNYPNFSLVTVIYILKYFGICFINIFILFPDLGMIDLIF